MIASSLLLAVSLLGPQAPSPSSSPAPSAPPPAVHETHEAGAARKVLAVGPVMEERPWRLVIWFDRMLSGSRTIRGAAGALAALVGWMAEDRSENGAVDRPTALLLVSDGFDRDPRELYLAQVRDAAVRAALEKSLPSGALDATARETARTAAELGWTFLKSTPRVQRMKIEVEIAEEQESRLRELAREQALPLEEVVRICVDKALAQPARDRRQLYARAATLVGAFADPQGATDLSADHDRYLYD